jgi:hypothetical protein
MQPSRYPLDRQHCDRPLRHCHRRVAVDITAASPGRTSLSSLKERPGVKGFWPAVLQSFWLLQNMAEWPHGCFP